MIVSCVYLSLGSFLMVVSNESFNFLGHIFWIKNAKSSFQTGLFLARCSPIVLALHEPTSVVHASECQNFFIKLEQKQCQFFADIANNTKTSQNTKKSKHKQEKAKNQKTQKTIKNLRKNKKASKKRNKKKQRKSK